MKARQIIDRAWQLWTHSCGIGVLVVILCIMIFGGEIRIHITFETLTELLKRL